jgi:hypothetical protein
MRSRKNDALTMSYTNSAADYQTMSETPRHKTGTKRHKNFKVNPVPFTRKTGRIADAATRNFDCRTRPPDL